MTIAKHFDNANAVYNLKHPVTVVNAGVVYKGKEYTTEQIEAMREWVSDCQWSDVEPDEIKQLTPFQILAGVEKHVFGGIEEFITCMM
jgi:hypothetical protein